MEKFERLCPICNIKLYYKDKKKLLSADKRNCACRSCGIKKQYINDPNKNKGDKNGRFNKSCYDIWVESFGKDIANQKLNDFKNKMKPLMSGKNNPMYGKSSPIGSGGGWSGWYNELYFRSLLELRFILEFYNDNPTKQLLSGERKEFYVNYTHNTIQHTYRPDFVCDNVIYEIKTSSSLNYDLNKIKIQTARAYYQTIGYDYIVIAFNNHSHYNIIKFQLLNLMKNGKVKLDKSTEIKLEKFMIKYKIQ